MSVRPALFRRPPVQPESERQCRGAGMVQRDCERCGAQFMAKGYDVRRGLGRFCSLLCANRAQKRPPLEERFWAKVNKTEDCWVWTAALSEGYGVIKTPGRNGFTHAHRVSWALHFGPIPPGLFVCHHCDNPPCVRPDHLFLGTSADNTADMWSKGRGARGERMARSGLTRPLIAEIRRAYATGGVTQRMLGAQYGVSQSGISLIVRGRIWA